MKFGNILIIIALFSIFGILTLGGFSYYHDIWKWKVSISIFMSGGLTGIVGFLCAIIFSFIKHVKRQPLTKSTRRNK